MAKAVIAYDKDLPEIPGRRPWEKPNSFLVKDDAAPTGWRENTSGRRPSRLLLVPKIRKAVDAWRKQGVGRAPRSGRGSNPLFRSGGYGGSGKAPSQRDGRGLIPLFLSGGVRRVWEGPAKREGPKPPVQYL